MSNLMEAVLPDLMLCENLGMFRVAALLTDLKHQLRSWSDFVEHEPGNFGTPA
jgi:hypothetical protein